MIPVTLVKTISDGTPSWAEIEDDGFRLAWQQAQPHFWRGLFMRIRMASFRRRRGGPLLAENSVNHAIDGDTVEIVITVADRNKGTAEAKIIDVLEHSIKTVVGQIGSPDEKA